MPAAPPQLAAVVQFAPGSRVASLRQSGAAGTPASDAWVAGWERIDEEAVIGEIEGAIGRESKGHANV